MIADCKTYLQFIHRVIHSQIPVKYIFLGIQKCNFLTISQTLEIYMTSKYYFEAHLVHLLDALETPYFEPKKKAIATN